MEIIRIMLIINIAYFSIIHFSKSRRIQRKNKIRMSKTIAPQILCYGCEGCTMTNKVEKMLGVLERKILRRILGPKFDKKKKWTMR
jgi:hypothetical protein